MQRHDRTRYIAFGLASALNALALLLHGLDLATRGGGPTGAVLLFIIILAGLALLFSVGAAAKRGRDLGWSAWVSVGGSLAAITFIAPYLLLMLYFSATKGQPGRNAHGDPPPPATFFTWLLALFWIAVPWIALSIATKVVS